MNGDQGREKAFVDLDKLTREQKVALLRELLADKDINPGAPPSRTEDLNRAEAWLWKRATESRDPKHKNARTRFWFIFMLLRHGGLRLKEIFALGEADIDLLEGVIYVKGENAREAPLPPEAARKLAVAWRDWPEAWINPRPFKCDASQARRVFQRCAQACELPPGFLNARSMRRNRGREMECLGAPADLVDIFLGRAGGAANSRAAAPILRRFIQGERHVKTSARNAFDGVVTAVTPKGIQAEVIMETAEGLKIAALITETSREALNLAPGKKALALVKAPWVGIERADGDVSAENVFTGEVTETRGDDKAVEYAVTLPNGQKICALCRKSQAPELKKGDGATVRFDPSAVILVADE